MSSRSRWLADGAYAASLAAARADHPTAPVAQDALSILAFVADWTSQTAHPGVSPLRARYIREGARTWLAEHHGERVAP